MKSFFEKLTGAGNDIEDDVEENNSIYHDNQSQSVHIKPHQHQHQKAIYNSIGNVGNEGGRGWAEEEVVEEEPEEELDGELTIDMYQKPDSIIIKTMIAGVKPEDLDISITRDVVTIKGTREEKHLISEDDYFARELYWGSFSRIITLPAEVDIESAEASEENGLLTIKLPKVDKGRKTKLKVKPTKH